MEGSPSLIGRTANLIPVKSNPFERDLYLAQAARIQAVYLDKTEAKAPKANVGKRDTLRNKILSISLFPNTHNKKFVDRYSDETS